MMNALTQYELNRSTLNGQFKDVTLDGREPRHVQRLGFPHQYYECYLINSQEQVNDFVLVVISSLN